MMGDVMGLVMIGGTVLALETGEIGDEIGAGRGIAATATTTAETEIETDEEQGRGKEVSAGKSTTTDVVCFKESVQYII